MMLSIVLLLQARPVPTVTEITYSPQTGMVSHRSVGKSGALKLRDSQFRTGSTLIGFWKIGKSEYYAFQDIDKENHRSFSIQLARSVVAGKEKRLQVIGKWSPTAFLVYPIFASEDIAVSTYTVGGDQPPREGLTIFGTKGLKTESSGFKFLNGVLVTYSGQRTELLNATHIGRSTTSHSRMRFEAGKTNRWALPSSNPQAKTTVLGMTELKKGDGSETLVKFKSRNGKAQETRIPNLKTVQISSDGAWILTNGKNISVLNALTGEVLWTKVAQKSVTYWLD